MTERQINKLTVPTKIIVKDGVGYRNDDFYGAHKVLAREVLMHEIVWLGNKDIVLTCRKLYPEVFECLEPNNKIDLRQGLETVYYNTMIMLERLMNAPIGSIKCMWFASPDIVCRRYGGNISYYRLPKNFKVISDLGEDGCLIATTDRAAFQKIK